MRIEEIRKTYQRKTRMKIILFSQYQFYGKSKIPNSRSPVCCHNIAISWVSFDSVDQQKLLGKRFSENLIVVFFRVFYLTLESPSNGIPYSYNKNHAILIQGITSDRGDMIRMNVITRKRKKRKTSKGEYMLSSCIMFMLVFILISSI